MRKLFNIIGLSTAVLMASCDMDRAPQGFLDPADAFADIQSVEYLEKGAYARLRDNYINSNVSVADIQADYVNSVYGFSNTYGDNYRWTFVQENTDIASVWNRCYLTIAQCNYILDNTAKFVGDGPDQWDGDALTRVELVRGRVFLMRAMSYSVLAERFCADYDETTARKEYSGVPKLETYSPDEKPGRATLYDIYDLILRDIEQAKTLLASTKDKGEAGSVYLNLDCVTAFSAHVYLQMDMYPEALAAANSLIANTKYGLADTFEEFDDVWTYDKGKEIIFKFAASKTELPDPYAQPFFYDQMGGTGKSTDGRLVFYWAPDYVPTQTFIDSFEEDDYRAKSWLFAGFADESYAQNFWVGQFIIMPRFTMLAKFSGNPDLRTTEAWNYCNAWKQFRIAEMYLIAAEAAVQTGGDAKTPLNTLRKHRGLKDLDNVTMAEVKMERYKELALEGFRLTDLKRWGDGFTRGESQRGTFYKVGPIGPNGEPTGLEKQKEDYITAPVGRDLSVEASNFRFIWPIPFSEIFANQNLSNQQNPGWER